MSNPTPLRADQRTLHGRVDRQVGALLVLSRRWHMYDRDPQKAFNVITESAAVALEVERAGIWMLEPDGSAIVCRELYEAGRHRHSRGFRFTREAAPVYFSALQTEGWIQAVDAHSDPRTAAFAGTYLVPNGIGALLDVPVRVGGRIAGVLRAEHTGGPRTFQNDELTSAAYLASLVALVVEADRASGSEARMHADAALTHAALDATGAAVIVLDQASTVLYYNKRMLELWNMPEELMGAAGNNGVRVQHVAAQTADPARFIARFRRISADDSDATQDVIELADGRLVERSSKRVVLDGETTGRAWTFREVSAPPAPG